MLTIRLGFYDVALVHVTIQITINHWWVKDQRATTIWCQEKKYVQLVLENPLLFIQLRERNLKVIYNLDQCEGSRRRLQTLPRKKTVGRPHL